MQFLILVTSSSGLISGNILPESQGGSSYISFQQLIHHLRHELYTRKVTVEYLEYN